jgi:hypothetical protein
MLSFLSELNNYSAAGQLILLGVLVWVALVVRHRFRYYESMQAWQPVRTDILNFSYEAISVLSELSGLCELDPEKDSDYVRLKRHELISKLSSLLERGRLLIPEEDPLNVGQDARYQDLRNKIINCITASLNAGLALNYRSNTNKEQINIVDPDFYTGGDEKIYAKRIRQVFDILATNRSAEKPLPVEGKDPETPGWSCQELVLESKQQFTTIIQDLVASKK